MGVRGIQVVIERGTSAWKRGLGVAVIGLLVLAAWGGQAAASASGSWSYPYDAAPVVYDGLLDVAHDPAGPAVGVRRPAVDRGSGADPTALVNRISLRPVGTQLTPTSLLDNVDNLAATGQRAGKGESTRAGQKLEQHQGGLFPTVSGNAAAKNALGQEVLAGGL